ncbi:hypothetical protein ACHWQZ_G006649 [Mnemiopsis leidyi]
MSRHAVETSFLGHRVPKEVKLLIKQLKTTKAEEVSASIDSVVSFLEDDVVPDFKKLDPAKSRTLFAGFYCILRLALRHKDLQENTFLAVLKDLSFSDQRNLVTKNKEEQFPDKFRDVDWRLDVVLSNNHLAKVLQPEVMLEIKMENKEGITLKLSQQEFHALRHSTARILHDMCQLRDKKFIQSK